MTDKIAHLDLRSTTLRRLARREICAVVLPLIPDMPAPRNDNRGKRETSYAERQGFVRHLLSYIIG